MSHKNDHRLVIVKRTLSVKKVMLHQTIVQVSVPRRRTVTGKFYYDRIFGKLNKYFKNVD